MSPLQAVGQGVYTYNIIDRQPAENPKSRPTFTNETPAVVQPALEVP